MSLSIGVDIVSIERIKRAMRRPQFVLRILGPEERDRPPTPEFVAGRWAAKEAVAKALGPPLTWHDVLVVTNRDGRPMAKVGNKLVLVSIAHERDYAVAMAVLDPSLTIS